MPETISRAVTFGNLISEVAMDKIGVRKINKDRLKYFIVGVIGMSSTDRMNQNTKVLKILT